MKINKTRKLIKLNKALNSALIKEMKRLVEERAKKLIEENPEEYIAKVDCGYYHNGVGFASYGYDYEDNEDKAFKDAWEELTEDIKNGGYEFDINYSLFIENKDVTFALSQLISELYN